MKDKKFKILNGKNILVTGGRGAIGCNLVRFLSDYRCRVIIIDNLSAGFKGDIPAGKNIIFYRNTILNDNVLKKVFRHKIDYVFHLAAHFANQNSIDHPHEDLSTNVLGTLKLLEYSRQHSVKRFIYASSSCVYGASDERMAEDFIKKLETPYAISKVTGEEYVHFFHRYYGMKTTVVRYFNAYGPGDPPGTYRNVIPNFFSLAMREKPLVITGTGDETRDFTFMDDVVRGTVSVLATDMSVGQVYNIGSGRETRILRIAKAINRITGNPAGIRFSEPRKWDGIKRRVSNINKSRRELGYAPRIPLGEGLNETWEWFRKKYGNKR